MNSRGFYYARQLVYQEGRTVLFIEVDDILKQRKVSQNRYI